MEHESEKLLETMALARPKDKDDLAAFTEQHVGPLERAIEARDFGAFEEAYRRAVDAPDVYHAKYAKGFLRFRLPDSPPEWFDLGPR